MHLHNSDVLTFLKLHMNNPNIENFLNIQKQIIDSMNDKYGTDHTDYLDYLEENIGDDASFTMDELKTLLRPRFQVTLNAKERKEFDYEDYEIGLDDLQRPVYIKDEGDFFTVWDKHGRVDIPVRLLDKFRKFLQDNHIEYEDDEIIDKIGDLFVGEQRGYLDKEDVGKEIKRLKKNAKHIPGQS